MEKKLTGQINPGKNYVIRYRPSGTEIWSPQYEFTAPKPTAANLSKALDSTGSSQVSKNRLYCEVYRNVNTNTNATINTWNSISFNQVASNEYEMWVAGDPTKISCPLSGWYQTNLTLTWGYSGTQPYSLLWGAIDAMRYPNPPLGGTPVGQNIGYQNQNHFYPDTRYAVFTMTSIPTYMNAGDYFLYRYKASNYTPSTPVPFLYGGGASDNNASCLYLGP